MIIIAQILVDIIQTIELKVKTKKELSEYYKAADIFVLPTREDIWGLVINEAMAYGLPVVTTNKCVSGVELVKDYKNGFIINVDDVKQLAYAINLILSDDILREKMSKESLKTIDKYTIENMCFFKKKMRNLKMIYLKSED